MVGIEDINPFADFSIGGMGTFANIGIVVVIAILILAGFGLLLYVIIVKKQYWIKIKVWREIGNVPTNVANYTAKEVAFGRAGDKLWRVASGGIFKFKVLKWLSVGKVQSAPREFWYWIREDGEWINYQQENINLISKRMGVKFVQEDMRLQRLATDRLLEQRHMSKTFWEKWGNTIMTIILFMIIAIAVVIVFYQFSKVVELMQPLIAGITASMNKVNDICANYTSIIRGGYTGLVPVE